jgi:esterase
MLLHHLHKGESPGDAPTVILLHGLFGSASNLGIVARALAPVFSVYSLDLRNHGLSPRAASMSYTEMATDVAQFIEQQGLAPCHVLGHSMGGKVAMQLALDRPELIEKLVLADIAPVQYPPHHDDVLAGLNAVATAAPGGRREADQVLSEHVKEASVRAFLLKSWQADEDGNYRWLIHHEAVCSNYAGLGEANRGGSYSGETLFVVGGDSDYMQEKYRQPTLALFPNARVKVIAGAGHWLHAEKPALFNKLVLRFLQG